MFRRLLTPMRVTVALLWLTVAFLATQRIAVSATTSQLPITYSPQSAQRVADTRACHVYATNWCAGRLAAGRTLVVKTGAPPGTVAVAANITATGATGSTYLTAWSGDPVPPPRASILNLSVGQTVANFAIVPVRADGTFSITTLRPVHVIVDVMGFETPVSARTVSISVVIQSSGTGSPAGHSVTTEIRCFDFGLGRTDLTASAVLPAAGGTKVFSFPLRGDLQTECDVHLHPAEGGLPSWWTGAFPPSDSTAADIQESCLIPTVRGVYEFRLDSDGEIGGVSPPTGCTVTWTLTF